MRRILFILEKEFKQIFRNKAIIGIIIVMPIVQLILLANAATFETKNIKLFIVDNDLSSVSRELISKFSAVEYFDIVGNSFNFRDGETAIYSATADVYIEFPAGLEKSLVTRQKEKIQVNINAIDGAKAGLANGYINNVINEYNLELMSQFGAALQMQGAQTKRASVISRNWYNPEMNYKFFMVPGILVLLVTMIGAFLTAMNIVREKEIGTMEQLNVTPIRKSEFIIGKLIPFWLIGLFMLSFGMLVGYILYDLPFKGDLWLIFLFAGIYLFAILGFGLLISTVSNNQQQAMFITWFFLIIFILLSGLFTGVENMPRWAQILTYFNPVKYFIEVIRMVMLKGSGFTHIKEHFLIISIFAIILNTLAVMNYRKVN